MGRDPRGARSSPSPAPDNCQNRLETWVGGPRYPKTANSTDTDFSPADFEIVSNTFAFEFSPEILAGFFSNPVLKPLTPTVVRGSARPKVPSTPDGR